MYLPRTIDQTLSEWASSSRRKPLLLRGVRQCGKTSAVRNLANQFDNYIELNLEKQSEMQSLFEGSIHIPKILSNIEVAFEQRIVPGKTLLFIDEIQSCPSAITALRYFYEDAPDLHVIAAGSLLEIVLSEQKKIDFPVGRVRSIYMYPFSFPEFLTATGQSQLCQYLIQLNITEETNLFHDKFLDAYKTFLVVGGMPEAVAVFAETQSMFACQQVHRDIMSAFLDDFGKYNAHVSPTVLRQVFLYAVHNVCKQTKASSAVSGVSAYLFDEAIELLWRAGLVFPVKASPCDTLPLGATEKNANKKLLFFDTGIYLTECGLNASSVLSAKLFADLNKGDLVELETGLELVKNANEYKQAALYYWYRTGANAEVDYVIAVGPEIIPLEVKASGKGSMQSMYRFLDTHNLASYGIRLSMENFSRYERIAVYPVYAVCRIEGLSL